LHWSDYSTLELLGFLARHTETARLLVLGTYRPVEAILREHPLKHLKQELQIHGQCQEVPLALLSETAVTEYLALRFASSFGSNASSIQHRGEGAAPEPLRKLAHTIYQRTDGNPLFMVNVVDYLAERHDLRTPGDGSAAQSPEPLAADRVDTPPSIVEMIERNLDRLNPDEQAVLEVASVAGAGVSRSGCCGSVGAAH
jgi:predicted ATPase